MPSFGQNHEAGKADALAALAAFLSAATEALTSGVPLSEQLAWAPKEAASERLLSSGRAALTPADLDLLEGEAADTGETLEALAQRVLVKASANRKAVAKLTGLRRRVEADIAQANGRDAAHALVSSARDEWYQFLTQLGA